MHKCRSILPFFALYFWSYLLFVPKYPLETRPLIVVSTVSAALSSSHSFSFRQHITITNHYIISPRPSPPFLHLSPPTFALTLSTAMGSLALQTNPFSQLLTFEKTLASLESRLRHGVSEQTILVSHPLEQMADLYMTRPAGYRLDNLDRALLSYTLATRTLANSHHASAQLSGARLSAKLGKAWFLRLQWLAHPPNCQLAKTQTERAHLRAAADAIDVALQKYEDCTDWKHDPHQFLIYKDSLLWKGLIYDALYSNLDSEYQDPSVEDAHQDLETKRKLWRRIYKNGVIQSLKKVFTIDKVWTKEEDQNSATPDPQPDADNKTSPQPDTDNKTSPQPDADNKTSPQPDASSNADATKLHTAHQISGIRKARAILCLARAYVDTSSKTPDEVSWVLDLLATFETVLAQVDIKTDHDGFKIDDTHVLKMKQEAHSLQESLSDAGGSSPEGRCVVC